MKHEYYACLLGCGMVEKEVVTKSCEHALRFIVNCRGAFPNFEAFAVQAKEYWILKKDGIEVDIFNYIAEENYQDLLN